MFTINVNTILPSNGFFLLFAAVKLVFVHEEVWRKNAQTKS